MCSETHSYFKGEAAEWYQTVVSEERMRALYPLLEEVVLEGVSEGFFRVKYPSICGVHCLFGHRCVFEPQRIWRGSARWHPGNYSQGAGHPGVGVGDITTKGEKI